MFLAEAYEKSAIKRLINDIERRVTFDSWKRSPECIDIIFHTLLLLSSAWKCSLLSFMAFMVSNILNTNFKCWNFILAEIFIAALFKRGLCLEHKNVNNSIDKRGTERSLNQLVVLPFAFPALSWFLYSFLFAAYWISLKYGLRNVAHNA